MTALKILTLTAVALVILNRVIFDYTLPKSCKDARNEIMKLQKVYLAKIKEEKVQEAESIEKKILELNSKFFKGYMQRYVLYIIPLSIIFYNLRPLLKSNVKILSLSLNGFLYFVLVSMLTSMIVMVLEKIIGGVKWQSIQEKEKENT